MQEYLEEQRKNITVNFGKADMASFNPSSSGMTAAADSLNVPSAAGSSFSPASTLSSVSSSDLCDFVLDFRQAYNNLRNVREPGKLTKNELGDVLYLLDQELPEEMLCEMFSEVDIERKGVVDFEAFLCIMGSRIKDGSSKNVSSARQSPPTASTPITRRVSTPCTSERAAASARAAASGAAGVTPSITGGVATPSWPPRPSSNASVTSSEAGKLGSGRKGKGQVLWWGFQDLAETL
mmetsp:Transcript_22692/g.38821  ORF Transcript_22692/g.38821 Transcript_22692/m.38821 type:complete len:237 (+) Transcript_22692:50-760(+)